ncbi:hypothetical protein TNIN_496701 [Trichonephila inaurata madagascariensis]|uniref:Uncharacterized protein n=1 Tax=Trichonephila inaurata madagascariensis TaxID=2747483 RepID=A0A8X6X870_9ARAC|nr:hypothetical protein TNIN_496701 [Trichonephila inaurata madagascariensis]
MTSGGSAVWKRSLRQDEETQSNTSQHHGRGNGAEPPVGARAALAGRTPVGGAARDGRRSRRLPLCPAEAEKRFKKRQEKKKLNDENFHFHQVLFTKNKKTPTENCETLTNRNPKLKQTVHFLNNSHFPLCVKITSMSRNAMNSLLLSNVKQPLCNTYLLK